MGLAGPASAETLAEAISAAYDTNPDILAQRALLRAINERYIQARAALGFTADASFAYQTQHALVDSSIASGNQYTAETSNEALTVIQPLYSGGRGHAGVQVALANIFVNYQNVRREETRILDQVVTAYVDVQRDQQIVAISQENVRLLEGQVGETRAKLAVKEATLTDRDQGFARLAQAQAQLVIAQGRLLSSQSAYRAVVGHDPADLAPPPVLPDLADTMDGYDDIAENSNPQLLSAEFQERSSRAGILQAKGERMPSVALRGDVTQGPLVSYNDQLRNNNQTVRVVVSVPLFSSGAVTSRIKEAQARHDSDTDLIDSARRQVQLSVAQSWQQLDASQQAIKLYDQQVTAQSGVYKGTKIEEKFALRSTLDILNAAEELNNARLARANAEHDAYAGKAGLLAAAGKLDLTTFGMTVPPDGLSPDIAALNRRDRIPWTSLIDALDGIGQAEVMKP